MSRRCSYCPRKFIGINVSRGLSVPAPALPVYEAPKPANRIPIPSRNQAGSGKLLHYETALLRHAGSIGRRGRRHRDGRIAAFVRRVGMPAQYEEKHKETYDIGERHMPAVVEPAPDRLRLGVHVRQRHAGARAEPDHRAAESDAVGKITPVVAALL